MCDDTNICENGAFAISSMEYKRHVWLKRAGDVELW